MLSGPMIHFLLTQTTDSTNYLAIEGLLSMRRNVYQPSALKLRTNCSIVQDFCLLTLEKNNPSVATKMPLIGVYC